MAEAEQFAQTFDPQTSSTQGHYSFGVVYEEEDYHLRKQREIRQIGISLREALGKGNREI
jgi:hypothetical protein